MNDGAGGLRWFRKRLLATQGPFSDFVTLDADQGLKRR